MLGSGGREHAMVRALARDPAVSEIHVAPGNPGMATQAQRHVLNPTEPWEVLELVRQIDASLVVIGPEAPLVAGVADAIRDAGTPCFGPSAAAARLESSKSFAKEIMAAAGVPTATAHVCTTSRQVSIALDAFGAPYVVKDDGLAAGKGVVVTFDRTTALEHGEACIEKSGKVVVEEYLDGPEMSVFVLCDGNTAVPLAPAQDFKRVGDGDTGPNTGGMGAYSPLPWAPPTLVDEVVTQVAKPVLAEMARRGQPFTGVLYCGLALGSRGTRVIEFNVRLGDPEAQVVLERLTTPLGSLLLAAATGRLADVPELTWRDDAAVCVVLAAKGYPVKARIGDRIRGLDEAGEMPGVVVLHAGTAVDDEETVRSAGGRVLNVVGLGLDLAAARAVAYDGVARIRLKGSHYRSDIAADAANGLIRVGREVVE